MHLQLEGRLSEADPLANAQEEIRRLNIRVRQLDEALRLERLKEEAATAGARELQKILSPLHKALAAVFGEINEMQLGNEPSMNHATGEIWHTWKHKLGGKKAEIIEALESHAMSRDQIRVATSSGWSTVDEGLKYLRSVGLIEKSGNKWHLKSL